MQALKSKLENLISNYHFTESSFSTGFFENLNSIGAQIHKQKHEWISLNEANQLLYTEVFARLNYGKFQGNLIQFIDPTEFASHILSLIDSIPKPHLVSFSLPGIDAKNSFNFDISDSISFRTISDLDYFPHHETLLGGPPTPRQIACIQINTQGFFRGISAGESLNHPLSLFKVVIERCLFGGLFRSKYMFPNLLAAWPMVSAQDSETKDLKEINLSSVDKNFIRKISFHQSPLLTKSPQKEQKRYVFSLMGACRLLFFHQNDNAKRIIAASEWRYEALAEESPVMSLVKTCVGLEAIFGEQNSEGGITSSLADRCAFSLAKNHEERTAIASNIRRLYRWRSNIVHGVKSRLDSEGEELLQYGKALLGSAITNEIRMLS